MAIRDKTPGLESQRGFTLVEVTIILLVLVILSSIMLPQLGNFNRLARYVKVNEDLGAICATMKKFLDEVMVNGPFGAPGGGTIAPVNKIGLLVGEGSAPTDSFSHGIVAGDWALTSPGTDTLKVNADIGTTAVPVGTFDVDDLSNHLQINNPLGSSGASTTRYKNEVETTSVGPFFGWRGPYFNEITADPWGFRYAINTFGLHTNDLGTGRYSTAVICYSTGPDGTVQTGINLPHPTGFDIGGDDVAVVLSAMGPF